jgi:prephenate dehydratase
MATITVKDVPVELCETLRRLAKRNRRSLNGEVLFRLENSVQSDEPAIEEALTSIRKMREELRAKGVWLTDEFLNKAKNEGRP